MARWTRQAPERLGSPSRFRPRPLPYFPPFPPPLRTLGRAPGGRRGQRCGGCRGCRPCPRPRPPLCTYPHPVRSPPPRPPPRLRLGFILLFLLFLSSFPVALGSRQVNRLDAARATAWWISGGVDYAPSLRWLVLPLLLVIILIIVLLFVPIPVRGILGGTPVAQFSSSSSIFVIYYLVLSNVIIINIILL